MWKRKRESRWQFLYCGRRWGLAETGLVSGLAQGGLHHFTHHPWAATKGRPFLSCTHTRLQRLHLRGSRPPRPLRIPTHKPRCPSDPPLLPAPVHIHHAYTLRPSPTRPRTAATDGKHPLLPLPWPTSRLSRTSGARLRTGMASASAGTRFPAPAWYGPYAQSS